LITNKEKRALKDIADFEKRLVIMRNELATMRAIHIGNVSGYIDEFMRRATHDIGMAIGEISEATQTLRSLDPAP
jgi:hypothetical protein